MHTARSWEKYNPAFGTFDNLLSEAGSVAVPEPTAWVTQFLEMSAMVSSYQINSLACNLLHTTPYHLLAEQLTSYVAGKEQAEDLRCTRKFLMIPRDCLIVTSHDITNPVYDDLFKVIRKIGQIADGSQPCKMTKTISRLMTTVYSSNNVLSDAEVQSSNMAVLAKTKPQLQNSDFTDLEYFHQARKDFRRLVHISMAQAVVCPGEDSILLAHQGITLNRSYGAVKDSLYLGVPTL